MSLELLRRVSKNSAAIRALTASYRPRSFTPAARTEPLDMTPVYRERSRLAGVPFKASPEMDFSRPVRQFPTARPLTTPRTRVKRETLRSRTEASLNAKVTEPLSRLYGSRASEILRQASDEFHYRNPRAETSAEPYELFESGLIDSALENLRLRPWPIGRPRLG